MFDHIREIASPLSAESLKPLGKKIETLQFCERLTDDEHRKVARLLKNRSDVTLRAYGRPTGVSDLAFLEHYPAVRRVAIELWNLKSLDGIDSLPDDLEKITLGQTKSRSLSLAFLQRFSKLQSVYVEGHAKGIEVLSGLGGLQRLALRSVTTSDLAYLKSLKNLRAFRLLLGGTTDLGALASLPRLRYFEAWQVRGLADLSVLAELKPLTHLYLQNLARVTELPSFKRLRSLRWVTIEKLKSLTDLSKLAEAPSLEELIVWDMRQAPTETFGAFVGHKRLRRAAVGLGSTRRNKEVAEVLGVPNDITDKEAAYAEAVA